MCITDDIPKQNNNNYYFIINSKRLVKQMRFKRVLTISNKKDGYRQQNVRQRQKLISIIDYDVCILEIFNVKEWPDLEIWVWGPSRSLKKARFDRPCMTFY